MHTQPQSTTQLVQNKPIPFNKPLVLGTEEEAVSQVFKNGKLAAKGEFSKKCTEYFKHTWGFKHNLLTTSCTSALELAAIISEVGPGDEVILPSYTFVSTANAFILRGATLRFADSLPDHPNMDVNHAISLITPKTKAIVVVHYAGMAIDMDPLMKAADKHNIIVIEDAAQAIDSYYKNRPLGGIGHFGAFSFHETKNITCGEGGLFTVNDERFKRRAEIVHELGTNRSAFLRGEVDKYTWVDVGSSFFSSEILAGVLWTQLQNIEKIQKKRVMVWNHYHAVLQESKLSDVVDIPIIPEFATNNAHTYYLVMKTEEERNDFIDYMNSFSIKTSFHYQALHKSSFYLKKNPEYNLPNSEKYTNRLVRLPLYYDLSKDDVDRICDVMLNWKK